MTSVTSIALSQTAAPAVQSTCHGAVSRLRVHSSVAYHYLRLLTTCVSTTR